MTAAYSRSSLDAGWPGPVVDMPLAAWGATIGRPVFVTSTVSDVASDRRREALATGWLIAPPRFWNPQRVTKCETRGEFATHGAFPVAPAASGYLDSSRMSAETGNRDVIELRCSHGCGLRVERTPAPGRHEHPTHDVRQRRLARVRRLKHRGLHRGYSPDDDADVDDSPPARRPASGPISARIRSRKTASAASVRKTVPLAVRAAITSAPGRVTGPI